MAFNKRTWVNGEIVNAAKLVDLEDRLAEGLLTVPVEVSDPLVAGTLDLPESETAAAIKAKVQGWVADGTIPTGSGNFSVTETQPGVYEVTGLTVTETAPGVYEIGA